MAFSRRIFIYFLKNICELSFYVLNISVVIHNQLLSSDIKKSVTRAGCYHLKKKQKQQTRLQKLDFEKYLKISSSGEHSKTISSLAMIHYCH